MNGSPGLDTHDLLDLLLMYQGSMGTRIFSQGNLDYLELLLRVSKQLGRQLAEAPISSVLPRAKVLTVVDLIEQEGTDNFQPTAREVLGLLADLRARLAAARRVPDLHVRDALPPLPRRLDRVVVHFGAAMGLGDQITFYQLLRHVAAHPARPRLRVYTLYPGLWARLIPGTEEVGYREDPLRPFVELNADTMPAGGRELVISGDFEVFDLHVNIIAHRPWRDILEVSIGRMTAWLSSGHSPWIHVEELRQGHDGNYDFMWALARRLVPSLPQGSPWEPIETDRPRRSSRLRSLAARLRPRPAPPGNGGAGRRLTILVNPFTSKDLPFTADQWVVGIHDLRARLKGRVDFEVVIFPGIEPPTRVFAEEIRTGLEGAVPTRLLDADGEPLTAFTALPALLPAIERADLCLTADTFTAHLVPLFRVPTVVLAYPHFRRFWVPSRYTYNCLIEEMGRRGIVLTGHLLLLLSGAGPDTAALRPAASRLARATEDAHVSGISARSAAGIEAALAHAFQRIRRDFPHYAEAQNWLMLWSRLAWSLERHAVPPHGLRSYLTLWEQSDIFKLLTLAQP